MPMPQLIEANEAELKGYEEERKDSSFKHCSGDGGGSEDLHYLERECERGESQEICNGDSRTRTKEEGAEVQCENIVISSLNGNNGNTITSAERVESTFEGNEEQKDRLKVNSVELSDVVKENFVIEKSPQCSEETGVKGKSDHNRERRKVISRSPIEDQFLQLQEVEWKRRDAEVNGPFLVARKSLSPIQGTDFVLDESSPQEDNCIEEYYDSAPSHAHPIQEHSNSKTEKHDQKSQSAVDNESFEDLTNVDQEHLMKQETTLDNETREFSLITDRSSSDDQSASDNLSDPNEIRESDLKSNSDNQALKQGYLDQFNRIESQPHNGETAPEKEMQVTLQPEDILTCESQRPVKDDIQEIREPADIEICQEEVGESNEMLCRPKEAIGSMKDAVRQDESVENSRQEGAPCDAQSGEVTMMVVFMMPVWW